MPTYKFIDDPHRIQTCFAKSRSI